MLSAAIDNQVRAALAGQDAAALFTVAHLDASVFSARARGHRGGQVDADEVGRLRGHLAARWPSAPPRRRPARE